MRSVSGRSMWKDPSVKLIVAVVAVFCLTAFGYFVWPTPWVYSSELHYEKGIEEPTKIETRFSRFNGQKQTKIGGDWEDGSIAF